MLEEITGIDQVTVIENGQVWVRLADRILRDGVEIAKSYHRHVIHPGQRFDNEDVMVQAICVAVHTPDVVARFRLRFLQDELQ